MLSAHSGILNVIVWMTMLGAQLIEIVNVGLSVGWSNTLLGVYEQLLDWLSSDFVQRSKIVFGGLNVHFVVTRC